MRRMVTAYDPAGSERKVNRPRGSVAAVRAPCKAAAETVISASWIA